MSKFIKTPTGRIVQKPEGVDYDIINKHVYRIVKEEGMFRNTYDLYDDNVDITVPNNIIKTDEDDFFMRRVNDSWGSSKENLGIMLCGESGTGKTLMARRLCDKCNLPMIIVDKEVSLRKLAETLKRYTNMPPTCIMFDECDKSEEWNLDDLLEFTDGIDRSHHFMFVYTCNDDKNISRYVKDRCGRIKFYKKFPPLTDEDIVLLIKKLHPEFDKERFDEIITELGKITFVKSYDNILHILSDIAMYPTVSVKLILKDLNIGIR